MSTVIPHNWNVPEVFRARLGQQAGRQRIMQAEGHLLIILHKIPAPGESEREIVLFWRNPKGEWLSTERGAGLGVLTEHLNLWRAAVDRLEDQMQSTPSAENYFEVLQTTTPLLRTIRNTARVMQEARQACSDRAILIARDEAGELERAIELLHTDAQHGLEYMIARQGEVQARQTHRLVKAGHRLNVLVALFLPLTALGSLFGMNLAHGLENQYAPWLFWGLFGGGLFIGLLMVASILAGRGDAGPTPPPPARRPVPGAKK